MEESDDILRRRLRDESPAECARDVPSAEQLIDRMDGANRRKSVAAGVIGFAAVLVATYMFSPFRNQHEASINSAAVDDPKNERFEQIVGFAPPNVADHSPYMEASLTMNEQGTLELFVQKGNERCIVPLEVTEDVSTEESTVEMIPVWQLDPAIQNEIRQNWEEAGYPTEVQI